MRLAKRREIAREVIGNGTAVDFAVSHETRGLE